MLARQPHRPPAAATAAAAAAAAKQRIRTPSTACCRRRHSWAAWVAASAVMGETETVSYEWSWRQAKSRLPEQPSAFDAANPLPAELQPQNAITLLQLAAEASAAADADQQQQQPSQAWLSALLVQLQPQLPQLAATDACLLCQQLSQLDFAPEPAWTSSLLQRLCDQSAQLSTAQLAELMWSLSNLRHTLEQAQWAALLAAAAARLTDFYGPDLARLVAAAGSIYAASNTVAPPPVPGGSTGDAAAAVDSAALADVPAAAAAGGLVLPEGWAAAVAGEVEYQVAEFVGDLGAYDLARLASGLADLGVTPTPRLQECLLKAVYMRTRSIEEKGAVDFALAKLDAKGKRSMHYDPRWTHEELKWLPRRERDKRRLINENWYRTQWGGWRRNQS